MRREQVIKDEKLRLIAEGFGQCTWPDGSNYEGELGPSVLEQRIPSPRAGLSIAEAMLSGCAHVT